MAMQRVLCKLYETQDTVRVCCHNIFMLSTSVKLEGNIALVKTVYPSLYLSAHLSITLKDCSITKEQREGLVNKGPEISCLGCIEKLAELYCFLFHQTYTCRFMSLFQKFKFNPFYGEFPTTLCIGIVKFQF